MKSPRVSEDFVPVGEFKAHAAKLLRKLREARRSLVITQHGRPAAVLVLPEEFDALRERLEFLEKVHEGLQDAAAGRTTDHERLGRELEAEFAG